MSLRQLRFLAALIALFGAIFLPAPARAAGAARDAFAAMRVEPVAPPRPTAHLVLQATDGTPIRLADFKGRVVVVAFLLTNWTPCEREALALAALYREFNSQGVVMIGVHLEDDAQDVQSFGKRFGISFPLALESDERAKELFGISGCPGAVLIDREGQMVGRIFGARKWTSEPGRRLVRSLLNGPRAVAGQEARIPAGGKASVKKLNKAVHLVSAVKPNDPEFTKVLDDAAASLKAGDDVVILFDGQSVGALRMNPRKGQKTPLEETGFTSKEKQALAKRLGVRSSAAPRNQLEYVQHLARAGAKVFANGKSVRLSGLANEEIHPVARLVPMAQIEQLVDQSDGCYIYGGS